MAVNSLADAGSDLSDCTGEDDGCAFVSAVAIAVAQMIPRTVNVTRGGLMVFMFLGSVNWDVGLRDCSQTTSKGRKMLRR